MNDEGDNFTRTKTTNHKFDLLTLTERKIVQEASEGVNNVMCLMKGECDKSIPIPVNGLIAKLEQDAARQWSKLVSLFAYTLLTKADHDCWNDSISKDLISETFLSLTGMSQVPELLPDSTEDPAVGNNSRKPE